MKEEDMKKVRELDFKKEGDIEEVQKSMTMMLGEKGIKEEDVDDLKTMFHQDVLAIREAREKGLDTDDGFRVIRCGEKEDRPYYRVFGTEGREEKVKDEFKTMNKLPFRVGNEFVPSYKKKRWENVLFPEHDKR